MVYATYSQHIIAYTLHSDFYQHTSLKTMTHVFRNKHMLTERILQSASTHFSSPQASTSVWNNCRDQEVEFDWMHMFQAVTEQFETFFLANQRQQKQFFLQT